MRAKSSVPFTFCAYCGTRYKPRQNRPSKSGERFCTRQCLGLWRKKPLLEGTCRTCDAPMTIKPWRKDTTKYCSRRCSRIGQRRMRQPGIYAIRHVASDRVYVGSAADISVRWKRHRRELRRGDHGNPLLRGLWAKDGPLGFKWEVLEFVIDKTTLVAHEQEWIDKLDSTNRVKGFNFGSAAATFLGRTHTEAWKRSRSEHALRVTSPKLRSLTEVQAAVVAHALAGGATARLAAEAFGVSIYTVNRIATGHVYKHLDIPRRAKGASPSHNNRAFTPEQIAEIRRRKAAGERTRELMVEFGVHQVTIDRIASGAMYRNYAASATLNVSQQ